MIGAIIGDIAGSPYEFNNVYKRSAVKFLENSSFRRFRFTDDSVLTIAVAKALTENLDETDDLCLKRKVAEKLKEYYRKYPLKGTVFKGTSKDPYGEGFKKWAESDMYEDRSAYTNGAAMRAASIGWLYDDLDKTMQVAEITARPTHNSLNAIEATQAVACTIFLARHKKSKLEIKEFLETKFEYQLGGRIEDTVDIHKMVSKIRTHSKRHRKKVILEGKFSWFIDCDAKRTVENAIYAFLISKNFDDCIRTAISFGGDSDTIACIAGSIAEAYYGVPKSWRNTMFKVLHENGCKDDDIVFLQEFCRKYVTSESYYTI